MVQCLELLHWQTAPRVSHFSALLCVYIVNKLLKVEILGPQDELTIGDQYTLTCTARIMDGLMQSSILRLTLKIPNGTKLNESTGMSTSVSFDSLHVEDGGEYICVGKIDISSEQFMVEGVTIETKQNITLKCKSDIVLLNVQLPYTASLLIVCSAYTTA